MDLLVSVPAPAGEPLAPWLEAVAVAETPRAVELPGDRLDDSSGWEDLVEALGLSWRGLLDLLPEDLGRHLPDADPGLRDKLLGFARERLTRAAMLDVRYATLGLGLERLPAAPGDGLAARVALMHGLLATAQDRDVLLAVPTVLADVPPARQALATAEALVHDVMHPACRLAVHVRLAELPGDFDPGVFLARHGHAIGVLRFGYEPGLGLRFPSASQRAWAAACQDHGFRGEVVFCPLVADLDAWRAELRRLATRVRDIWA